MDYLRSDYDLAIMVGATKAGDIRVGFMNIRDGKMASPGPLPKNTAGGRFDTLVEVLDRYINREGKFESVDEKRVEEACQRSKAPGAPQ